MPSVDDDIDVLDGFVNNIPEDGGVIDESDLTPPCSTARTITQKTHPIPKVGTLSNPPSGHRISIDLEDAESLAGFLEMVAVLVRLNSRIVVTIE